MTKSKLPLFVITAVVRAPSLEEAETVACERLDYDEDYGFEYRFVDHNVAPKEVARNEV